MPTRTAHRLRLVSDGDALHALAVAAAACVFSAGLVYVGYFVHVLRIARNAPCESAGDCVLVFGKHAPGGRIDLDFEGRLDRAVALWRGAPRNLVLLGGGAPGEPAEADVARLALVARGIAADAPLLLESRSRDTMQNLRNARDLLRASGVGGGRVVLLSSRYHLARCLLFARGLGFDAEPCAAEPRWRWSAKALWQVAGEAAYVCWTDVGARWARLIGHRRMLSRLR